MGKPFDKEIAKLPETFAWAANLPVVHWEQFRDWGGPLIAIGSGGAFTLATFAAYLHETQTGAISRSETPLLFARSGANLKTIGALAFSSSGRNPDILQAARSCIAREASAFFVMCGAPGSQLVKVAEQYQEGSTLSFELPAGKDGFLATNSLVAMSTVLYRLYRGAIPSFEALACEFQFNTAEKLLYAKENVCILHSDATRTAAVDLESKLSEAALAAPLVSDFRNFAHGRHYWIAQKAKTTAIITFEAACDRDMVDRTISLLPKVPILRIRSMNDGPLAAMGTLLSVFQIVSRFGEQRSIDPGRPGIPIFGRKIYNLKFSSQTYSGYQSNSAHPAKRKAVLPLWRASGIDSDTLNQAAQVFLKRLTDARFGALILDYDGTLCSASRRFSVIEPAIVSEVRRLLDSGLRIGIATGRGRSVGEALRAVLPRDFWSGVIIGYYNGSVIKTLDFEESLTDSAQAEQWCASIERALRADLVLNSVADIEMRPTQITVTGKRKRLNEGDLWLAVKTAISRAEVSCVKVFSSTHSVDVVHHNTSKANLLGATRTHFDLAPTSNILAIGDRGSWPGNDAELLIGAYSLSVDDVSTDANSCWNLAPAGLRGTKALLHYLVRLKRARTAFRIDLTGGRQ